MIRGAAPNEDATAAVAAKAEAERNPRRLREGRGFGFIRPHLTTDCAEYTEKKKPRQYRGFEMGCWDRIVRLEVVAQVKEWSREDVSFAK